MTKQELAARKALGATVKLGDGVTLYYEWVMPRTGFKGRWECHEAHGCHEMSEMTFFVLHTSHRERAEENFQETWLPEGEE